MPTLWVPDENGEYLVADLNDLIVADAGDARPFDWSEAIRIDDGGRILLWTYAEDRFSDEDTPSVSVLLAPVPLRR